MLCIAIRRTRPGSPAGRPSRAGQRLRHFADHVAHTAGETNGNRVRQWLQDKKTGWYAVREDPQMSVTSTLLDQAHHAIERKLCAMKGLHHPGGSQRALLTG